MKAIPSLSRKPRSAAGFYGQVREFKRHLLSNILGAHGGNRTQAARALGIHRTYLVRMISTLKIRG